MTRAKKGLAGAAAALLMLLGGAPRRVSAAAAVSSSGATVSGAASAGALTQNTEFLIYNPAGTELMGKAHYVITRRDGAISIDGRSTFIDGEYDVEHETLHTAGDGPARLLTYQHDFFDAHGAPQIVARANLIKGTGSCGKYHDAKGTVETAELNFPPDTYAGASVLVPIADYLRRGATDVDLHVFDCANGPRLVTLHTELTREAWRFRPHAGDLARADAHPVFGWFDVLLRPFVPEIQLWFDPMRDFNFVGGTLSRYYRGPEVMLVGVPGSGPHEPALTRLAPPELTAPRNAAPRAPLDSKLTPQARPSAQAPAEPSPADGAAHSQGSARAGARDTVGVARALKD